MGTIMAVDYKLLTDGELAAEELAIRMEVERRRDIAMIPGQIDDLNRKMLEAGGVKLGDPWEQPTGAHDAYPIGWTVGYLDKQWESLVHGNVWEPGVSGWREVAPPDMTPEWSQPTGAHDTYKIGDVVTFEGMKYKSLADNNAWAPTAYPEGWELLPSDPPVEPAP